MSAIGVGLTDVYSVAQISQGGAVYSQGDALGFILVPLRGEGVINLHQEVAATESNKCQVEWFSE